MIFEQRNFTLRDEHEEEILADVHTVGFAETK